MSDRVIRRVRKELREMNGSSVLLQRLVSTYCGGRLEFKYEDPRLKGSLEINQGRYTLNAFGQSLRFGRAGNSAGHRWLHVSVEIAFARLCCERIGIDLARYFVPPPIQETSL